MNEVRLIDANALEEAVFDVYDETLDGIVKFGIEKALQCIDNVPTVPQVTVFAENASKEEIEDFKQELEKVLERPQGEWITDDWSKIIECINLIFALFVAPT